MNTQNKTLTILKIGGKIVEDEKVLQHVLSHFSSWDGPKILVHGGGRSADRLLHEMGIAPNMQDGRRVTDAPTLKAVTMLYAGSINKNLVAQLQALNCDVLGMSGADLNLIKSSKRPVGAIDFGFVGDIESVDSKRLAQLLSMGITPVLAPITHDGKGQLLNTNADSVASKVAAACAKNFDVKLLFCLDKEGVLACADDSDSTIPTLSYQNYKKMKQEQTIAKGMLPKLFNGFEALNQGAEVLILGKQGLNNPIKMHPNLTTLCML